MAVSKTRTTPDTDMDLDKLDARALREPMVVVEDDPALWNDSEVAVYSEDRRYAVSLATGFCECPDAHYRGNKCKHQRRAEFALGRRKIPGWVNMDVVDDQLRRRLEERGRDE
ncbi:SWIM zinc finger family protein [Haloferax volcanii]|uniref:SWIM zinc finger family protein n=1 Tax=Haloferax volcanii TaxID=2246 RepID=UPI00249B9B46|nr:SWIM zinc finger family protein [Haloferax alexandrinus]WEL29824.1 hypothetical protein HBNXHx_1718 [Haloferax alexandrinus]